MEHAEQDTLVVPSPTTKAHIYFCYVASMYPEKNVHSFTLHDLYQAASAIDQGARPGVDAHQALEDLPLIVTQAIDALLKADPHMDVISFLVNLIEGYSVVMPEGVGVFSSRSAEAAQLMAYEEHIFGRL